MTRKGISLGVASAMLVFGLGFIVVNWKATNAHAETQSYEVSMLAPFHAVAGQGPAAQGADKPVEQTRKNIQVLKGMPDSQLFPVMNFFGASLGVSCAYCHVRTGDKWEFEKDDKPEKQTAREMIKMVLGVNKENFGGNTAVSCYTCHRGQTQVIGIPPLPLPAPRQNPSTAAPGAKTPAALPTAEQVLAKYVQAIGGKTAFEKLKTRVQKGSVVIQGQTIPLEIYQTATNKILYTATTPGGSVEQGFNGTVGWAKNPRGQFELRGIDLARIKSAAEFSGGIGLEPHYARMRLTGREKIGEREAYGIRAQTTDGRAERLFFDTQTGLLLRRIVYEKTMIGMLPEQTDYEDYQEVDGVKLPFTINVNGVDRFNSAMRKITEIKHNVPVDDARFNMPAASK